MYRFFHFCLFSKQLSSLYHSRVTLEIWHHFLTTLETLFTIIIGLWSSPQNFCEQIYWSMGPQIYTDSCKLQLVQNRHLVLVLPLELSFLRKLGGFRFFVVFRYFSNVLRRHRRFARLELFHLFEQVILSLASLRSPKLRKL